MKKKRCNSADYRSTVHDGMNSDRVLEYIIVIELLYFSVLRATRTEAWNQEVRIASCAEQQAVVDDEIPQTGDAT